MKTGAFVTAAVAMVALGAVVAAFSMNASPYVTVAEAKTMSGDRLHVAGDVIASTVHVNSLRHTMSFDLYDKTGTIHVVHLGEIPSNLSEMKKVVAIGGFQNGRFESQQLLVKCPSKYEPEKPGQVATR